MIQFLNFKKNRKGSGKAGFIQIVLIVVGALVLLKYVYNIDIVGFLTQGRFRGLLDQIYGLAAKGWQNYSHIIIKLWNYLIDLIKNLAAKIK